MDQFDAAPVKTTVAIKDIVERPEWQVREALRPHIVHQYGLHYIHGAEMPPIRLANVGGVLVLVDGWHRLAALRQLGRETTEAVVEQLCEDEARWPAAIANTRNGVRLKKAELLQAFHVYVRTRQYKIGRKYKTYRQIARDFGGAISKNTANRWMREHYGAIAGRMAGETGGSGPKDPGFFKRSEAVELVKRATDQAVAEARAVECAGCRWDLAKEFERAAQSILKAVPWTPEQSPQAFDDNTDF